MSWVDPTYAYLFNGLNLASGHWEVGHTDHPGTPLQLITMLVIKATNLFRKESIIDDVLRHPELYIKLTVLFLILLNTYAIYYLGKTVFSITQNIKHALFLQLTTLSSVLCTGYLPNLMTEPLIIFFATLLISFLFRFVFSNETNKNYPLILGALCGVSIATKFSSITFILIPLILLPNFKGKTKFIFYTLISFLLFTIPIWYQYNNFTSFIKNILTHTENYGAGEEGFIDTDRFLPNLLSLLNNNYIFTSIFLLLLVILIKNIYRKNILEPIARLNTGLFLLFSAQLIMVSKHFSFHYMIPAHVFCILALYAAYNVFKNELQKLFFLNFKNAVIGMAVIALLCYQTISYQFFPNLNNPKKITLSYLTPQQLSYPRIILTGTTSIFKEPAMWFGKSYSGTLQNFYNEQLKKQIPNSYLYNHQKKELFSWDKSYSLKNILSTHHKIILYYNAEEVPENDFNELFNRLIHISEYNQAIQIKKLFTNTVGTEKLYELTIDTLKTASLFKPIFHLLANGEVDSNNVQYTVFKNYGSKDSTQVYKGTYSISVQPSLEFALSASIPCFKNKDYEVSVWRHKNTNNSSLVVSGIRSEEFYLQTKTGISSSNPSWEQLKLNFEIPNTYSDSVINIYIWNSSKEQLLFDDLEISVFDK